MNRYKPYPAYKESGVEWLGKVPEHWDVKRLKFSISSCQNGIWGEDAKEDINDIPCVRVADFDRKNLRVILSNPTIRNVTAKEKTNRILSRGNLLLEKSGGGENQPVGCVVLYADDRPAVCSNFVARMEIAPGFNSSFVCGIHAAAYSVRLSAGSINQTSGIQNLDQERYFNERAAFPLELEQQLIANALDRETTRIDSLITKKSRFIELLKEKRQSLITHAVTKGLDPNVKMKDSGEKWLKEIPLNWDVIPSHNLFPESKERAMADDEHLSATQKYGVIPLAEYERLEERQVTHAVKNLDQRKHAEIDQFVISMRSFEGGIERVKARGCVRSSYVVLKAGAKAHIGFFTYLFKSSSYIQGLQATATFIRDGQDLSYSNFRQVKLPHPSLNEQKLIADFLEQSVSRIDRLASKTQRSIDLLKERRSAFITAAVTGQIDLRESE
jgi:type I restriction enzyme S subunit